MLTSIQSYYHWLHGKWPAGLVEKLPVLQATGRCNVPGVYVVGDLTGVPLLKFSSDTGAKSIKDICSDPDFDKRSASDDVYDVVIIGGGVSGYAAAIEAKTQGLRFLLIEANSEFSTIENFPTAKPIFTYPTAHTPESDLDFKEDVDTREKLLSYLQEKIAKADIQPVFASVSHIKRQSKTLDIVADENKTILGQAKVRAHRVVVAIGRSGKYRQLDVPGFHSDKVSNRLHDPAYYKDKNLLVLGGGDSAVETAIACTEAGANVTLSYRKAELNRPKHENIEKVHALAESGKLSLELGSTPTKIEDKSVTLKTPNGEKNIANDNVLSMLGREAPLDFFRRSGIQINGETKFSGWVALALFVVFAALVYDWKGYGFLNAVWNTTAFPNSATSWVASLGDWWFNQVEDRSTLVGTIAVSMKSRSFYYTLIYTLSICIFAWLRIKRRKTPYVTLQTCTLVLVQAIPLFILPEVILPWLGYIGAYDSGFGLAFANELFPSYISVADLNNQVWPDWGHPRAYWRAYGFILAWPLNVYNIFTEAPIWGWVIISIVQTFVIIPLLIYKWGKGAYCGWICSCGALAETVGDTQRHKMPHGPRINKLNMIGQVILFAAFVMLAVRIGGWIWPDSWMNTNFQLLLSGTNTDNALVNPISWKWTVDILFGGILGVGLYFKYSGRVWCRFACPLAALMHIYSRFSKFRIFADKSKCISCNACTSVCHQGIDVMSFANKGKPMEDPQCVRCSACVQTCPTGVLQFGEINRKTGEAIKFDRLPASQTQMAELIQVKNVS